MKMDHKEIVTDDLNWLHLALTDCCDHRDKPTRSRMFQLTDYRLLFKKDSVECFLLALLLLLFTVVAYHVQVKPETMHRRVQQLQSLKADTLTLLDFAGKTVQRFLSHSLQVVDA